MTKRRTKGGDWQYAQSVYGTDQHAAADGGNVISMTGGRKKRKGGRGMMTDIAVPAALLVASNYLGRKKTQHRQSHRKRVRFTRRRR